jgi:MoxR-like ATPase
MEERQVTVDGVTHPLGQPFLVLATQNPIEYEGTFPLPEAQLDRFLMRVSIGYPSRAQQVAILDAQQFTHPLDSLQQVTDDDELLRVYEQLKAVHADPLVKEYIVSLVDATRQHPDVYLGSSPRGALTLYRTAQARAALSGRDYVIPDDVKALVPAALSHRIILAPSARIKGVRAADVLAEVLADTNVPGARVR